ncbi:baseplate J/gp47 family protein [Mitsuaria sp. GD03876]|uniref:baseplate assembly protein n=1 Tax=Mitsuaria sp. GD03876 TaxID=2975399 RepID=UPI00244A7E04|nr:baseplate J/gp47 family protein [Mitsuaria sp. GD03876]MDH0866453.1 baseplate J/gp47 family protein [Mitsuaria sp. GD03876]
MIDLPQLPAPAIVEALDFETLLAERKRAFLELMPEEQRADLAQVLSLESEPLTKLLEENVYRELIWRQRVNEAAKASLLAYAQKTDLDNRAADYGVRRLLLSPADPDAVPPVDAVYESDERLRYRCQMALEGLTVAGSRGAYHFHALSAHAQISDASIDSPTFEAVDVGTELRALLPAGAIVVTCSYAAGLVDPLPGDVTVAVLPAKTASVPADELVTMTQAALSADEVRPLTDRPRVLSGMPTDYLVSAVLEFEDGPDHTVVLANANQRLQDAITAGRRLGGLMPRSVLFAALQAPGVRRVLLDQPPVDVVCDLRHYPNCTGVTIAQVQP